MENKRGKVWLAVAGLVTSPDGEWLVVKKRYGGLEGKWSLPAGFVQEGETADEAVLREIKEETSVDCTVKGLLGVRTGVIEDEISDNMLIFLLEPCRMEPIIHQESELYEAKFVSPDGLLLDDDSSILLRFLLGQWRIGSKRCWDGINPGDHFGYTSYKLFL
jgi:ADP-ribose pyrophosphatase YjhB (NUDIX family)